MIAFVTDDSFSHKGKYKPCLTFESCKYINCCLMVLIMLLCQDSLVCLMLTSCVWQEMNIMEN